MNLLQITKTTLSLYRAHAGWYTLAGLALFLTTTVGIGLMVGTLLFDMLLALFWGTEGQWIHYAPAVASIIVMTASGFIVSSVLIFAGLGAFVHACAQIGAGVREITIINFLEYMRRFGGSFWPIGMAQLILGCALAIPVLLVGTWLAGANSILAVAVLILAILAFIIMQWPLWLAFGAQVVDRRGAIHSMMSAAGVSFSAPLTSMVGVFGLGVLFMVPLPMLVFYPLYFYLLFAPLAAIFGVVYYEAARGMIK